MSVAAMAQSALGMIPKAILCAPSAEYMELYANAAMIPSVGGKSATDAMDALMLKNANLVQKQMYVAAKGGRAAEKVMMETIQANNYCALEVQYNPSSIYFTSQEGYSYEVSDGGLGGQARQVSTTKAPSSVTMSCELIFDAMNKDDAFGISEQGLTPDHLLSAGMDVAVQMRGGYSVSEQVNAIIACLFSSMTRQVIFYWGGMSFRGELTSVSATYTMFNKDGNPIRANVQIEIYQKNEDNVYDQSQYKQAFEETFKSPMAAKASGFMGKINDKLANNMTSIRNASL